MSDDSEIRPSRIRIWASLPLFCMAKLFCWFANLILGEDGYATFIAGPQGFAAYLERINEQTGENWQAVRVNNSKVQI